MIKVVLTFFLVFPLTLIAQGVFTDTIIWSGKQLSWDAFKGNYDTVVYNRQYSATTFWRVRYQYKTIPPGNEILFTVYAWFSAGESWVRPDNFDNDKLLLHEQGHFDLAELLARQFRQRLSTTIFIRANYADSIKTIFGNLLSAAQEMQRKYDEETSHGMNNKRQNKWQTFIAEEVRNLEVYADKTVTARLVK